MRLRTSSVHVAMIGVILQVMSPMDNIWIGPWAIYPHYLDPTLGRPRLYITIGLFKIYIGLMTEYWGNPVMIICILKPINIHLISKGPCHHNLIREHPFFFNEFQNLNNVPIGVGGWVTAIWLFGFQNPLVVKIVLDYRNAFVDK